MNKIKVMLSSTVRDLGAERDAIEKLMNSIEFVEVKGVDNVNHSSQSMNAIQYTRQLAQECDLYILLLGNNFGFELPNGKSATEIEFDAAIRTDPTKILVFEKVDENICDEKQTVFKEKVFDYFKGYWKTEFRYSHELATLVENSFYAWLKNRAAIGSGLSYVDHFVRLAIQIKPEANSEIFYKVTSSDIELEYVVFGKQYEIHFSKSQILRDFWGCISNLNFAIESWIQGEI